MKIYILTYSVWPAGATPTDNWWLANEENSRLIYLGQFPTRERNSLSHLVGSVSNSTIFVIDDMPEAAFVKVMKAEGYKTEK